MIGETEEIRSIREILKKNPRGMSITDISRELNLNRNSVAKYVNMLLVAGQAEMKTHAAAKVYFLSQRVPLSATLDFSTDSIVIVNSELSIVQANDNFLALANSGQEDLFGRSLKELALPVFSDETILSNLKEAINGVAAKKSFTWKNPEETLFLQVKLVPTVFEDGSAALTIILENITGQVQAQRAILKSEAMYRAIVEDQTELVCRFGTSRAITFVNDACARFTRSDKMNVIGKDILGFIKEEDRDRFISGITALNREKPTVTLENRIVAPDTTVRWMQWVARGTYDSEGKILEYQVVGRDITELRESTEEIRQLLRKKETLIAEINYRTRSNLHFITSLIDIQAGSRCDPESLELLREEKNQIMALARIYEELSHSEDLKRIPVLNYLKKLGDDLYSAYRINSDRIRLLFAADDIRLDINTAIPVGLIFNELVSNSLKYAFPENRTGTVTIEMRRDNDTITFTVADDGTGIPESCDITSPSSVGLEIVSTLTRQIHGKISLARENGTRFSIVFPLPEIK
ncbi:MAG: PAS domain S-box protein [Methanoregula sp.]|nr:PAS domain S-box protein [Methanoregula sp.]